MVLLETLRQDEETGNDQEVKLDHEAFHIWFEQFYGLTEHSYKYPVLNTWIILLNL